MNIENIKNITVCGAGTMGHGIAQVCAQNGFMVRLYDIKEESIILWKDKYRQKPRKRNLYEEKLPKKRKIQCLNNLVFTTNLEEACKDSHLIIGYT